MTFFTPTPKFVIAFSPLNGQLLCQRYCHNKRESLQTQNSFKTGGILYRRFPTFSFQAKNLINPFRYNKPSELPFFDTYDVDVTLPAMHSQKKKTKTITYEKR